MLNKQRVFLIDLDNTLVNSDKVNKATLNSIKTNLPSFYNEYCNKYVNSNNGRIKNFPNSLSNIGVSKKLIRKVILQINYKKCLNYGVKTTLNKLQFSGELILFTTGNKTVQNRKARQTNILKYFSKIIVLKNKNTKIPNIVGNYKNYQVIIIDDKLEVLDSAKLVSNKIQTIWVMQGYHANNNYKPKFKPNFKIKKFLDLPSLNIIN